MHAAQKDGKLHRYWSIAENRRCAGARGGPRSILSVFAHPDDELAAAGFLADAARRDGVMVRTITATHGESGHPDPPVCRQAGAPRHFGGDKGRAIAEKQRPPQYPISIEPETKIRGWEIEKSQQSWLRKAWHKPPRILYQLNDREFFAVAAAR